MYLLLCVCHLPFQAPPGDGGGDGDGLGVGVLRLRTSGVGVGVGAGLVPPPQLSSDCLKPPPLRPRIAGHNFPEL